MSDKSQKVAITNEFQDICIRITVQLHVGRIQGSSTLDVVEVDGLGKRVLCNQATAVFGSCYIKKLLLPAMRAMADHDKRMIHKDKQ